MKDRFLDDKSHWSVDGPKINAKETLDVIRRTLEDIGPIITERALFKGGGVREWRLFDEFEPFLKYLEVACFAGDRIAVRSACEILRDNDILVAGRCPDNEGRVPLYGAY